MQREYGERRSIDDDLEYESRLRALLPKLHKTADGRYLPGVANSSATADVTNDATGSASLFGSKPKARTDGTDTPKNDTTSLKFSVADGKLKIGTIKKSHYLEIEGGEVNLYKRVRLVSAPIIAALRLL